MKSNSRLFIFGETAVFCLVFLYAGLYFRPADPFLLLSSYQVYLPFALVLTLAGGTGAGLVALVFAGVMAKFYYTPYPYQQLLWTALVTLATGEFKIYWDRKIHLYSEERDYFREKLRDLTRNFILLKMSHERLEKNYILRPVSIRRSLEEIRGMLLKEEPAACQSLMDLLANFYGLESAALFVREDVGAVWREAAKTGLGAPLDLKDPLVQLALAKKETAFFAVSSLRDEGESAYVAVIPYFDTSAEQPSALLIVREIPFLQLNRDNLLTLALYLSFFMSEFVDTERFSAEAEAFPRLDSAVFNELARLQKLRRNFGVDSVLVSFHADYGDLSKQVSSFIESEIRGLDLSYSACEENCVTLVILPLTDYSNSEVFTSRVEEKVSKAFASFAGTLKKKVLPITGDAVLPLLRKLMEP